MSNPGNSSVVVSNAHFPDWTDPSHFKDFANKVQEESGGIPIGVKLSFQHIEKDIDVALEVGVDYINLDGNGGATSDGTVNLKIASLTFSDEVLPCQVA